LGHPVNLLGLGRHLSYGRPMASEILINVRPLETRVAVLENENLVDLMIERSQYKGLAGSIYRGRVSRVLPGMQAAFVDIGLERAAFLYVGDVREPDRAETSLFVDGIDEQNEDGDLLVEQAEEEISLQKTPIQELLHEGQIVLVQVSKDPLGTKGARITTHISLPGRYVVYMPTLSHLGISRRIEDPEERDRLRDLMESIRPEKGGLIIRTAGEGASEEQIREDIKYLMTLYDEISKSYQKRKTVGLLHTELDVELRAVRDLLTEDVKRVLVDEKPVFKKVQKFVSQFMPKLKNTVELYEGQNPIFDQFDIDLEISRSLGRKVWLKSGGYIIIDEAEALVVIDVNTGRYVGKKDFEDTIIKTNLEAVKEIAHQLRIRNCGGIIIIDFIDMEREVNREKVLHALKEELNKDRARTNVSSMSPLGLVEMTRKRIRPSLVKNLCNPCHYCDGKGYIRSKMTITNEIFREVERECVNLASEKEIYVHCHPDVANWIYDEAGALLEHIEQRYNRHIIFKIEAAFHLEQYEIYHKEFAKQK
jgi:ribonuclease G